MSDGIRIHQVNNPDRVPSTVTAIDGPQQGEARLIHPIALRVGRQTPRSTMNTYIDPASSQFEVPADGTYQDDAGDPFLYRQGDRIPFATAMRFPDFRDHLGDADRPVLGMTLARPLSEVPDVGPEERRALREAPENRMMPAPENREGAFVPGDQLTPQQKAARTRSENKAKESDDIGDDSDGSGE